MLACIRAKEKTWWSNTLSTKFCEKKPKKILIDVSMHTGKRENVRIKHALNQILRKKKPKKILIEVNFRKEDKEMESMEKSSMKNVTFANMKFILLNPWYFLSFIPFVLSLNLCQHGVFCFFFCVSFSLLAFFLGLSFL